MIQNALVALIFLNVPVCVLFLAYCLKSALDSLPLLVWLGGCLSVFIGLLGVASWIDEVEQRSPRQPDQ